MRRLALFVTLVLLSCGVAVAQQDLGNAPVSGATFVTGTLQSSTRDSLVLRLDSGDLFTLLLDDSTVGVMNRSAGTRLKVNYHVNDRGQSVADEIQGLAAKSGSSPIEAEASMPAPAPVATAEPVAPAAETQATLPPVEAAPAPVEPVATQDLPAASPPVAEDLPKTASHEPALALLGILALVAVIALRAVR